LQAKLAARGIDVPVQVMQSNGGIVSAAHAAARAVYAVESGPAAGVVAANWAGRLCGERNIIAFDMGGTTAKAGLVRDGEPTITHEFRIGGAGSMSSAGGASGFPIQIPVIDLAEVGSGGGSIAWVDPGGALQVGPRSAGADPGPACYDRGGEDPTVTDADLVLGYLNPEYFVGGEMKLSVDRARDAIERVGRELGIDLLDVAVGVHDIATANMATAIRQVTIQRGIDPREFAAVASGGSGPVHIVRVAQDFGIPRIIIPRAAGVMSAVGLVTSDIVIDLVRSKVLPLADADGRVIAEVFADLERRGVEELAGDGVDPAAITIRRSVEVRYQHQAYGIDIPVDSRDLTREVLDALPDAFFEAYRQQYGIDWRGPTEIVNVRARFIGDVQKLHATPRPLAGGTEAATTAAHRPAYFAEHRGFVETPVYNRDLLSPGQHVHGPAIVEERNSTVVIPPAYRAAVDAHANLVIERVAAPSQS
jgi:N-methylhydantoinase A